MKIDKKGRVFSGTRPTGKLHLGNYLGALKGYIDLQNVKGLDCIYSVVDLHGITTTIYKSKDLQTQIRDVVLDYLGAGLDPKKCHIMIQSQVPEHVELAYLLGTITPIQRVKRLPAYKGKKKDNPDNIGLLYYPILMAADILIYKSKMVPIGVDQEPHLRLAREIARKFNQTFGKAFPIPKTYFTETKYVPSLLGSGRGKKKKKMSKTKEGSYILLTDDLKTIKERLAKTPTDIGYGKAIPKEGGIVSLLELVEIFMGKKARQAYEKQYLGKGIKYAELKERLAKAIYNELKPIQKRRKYFEDHPKEVDRILEEGRKYCSKIAKKTLREAKRAMGLV